MCRLDISFLPCGAVGGPVLAAREAVWRKKIFWHGEDASPYLLRRCRSAAIHCSAAAAAFSIALHHDIFACALFVRR